MGRKLEGCPIPLSQGTSGFTRLLTYICDLEVPVRSDGT